MALPARAGSRQSARLVCKGVRACAIDFGAHTRLPGPHACRSTQQDVTRRRDAALHEMPSPLTHGAWCSARSSKRAFRVRVARRALGSRKMAIMSPSRREGGIVRGQPKSSSGVFMSLFARANLRPRLVVHRQIRKLGPAAPASARPVHSGSPARIGGGASPRLKTSHLAPAAKKAAARRLRSGERQ